MKINGTKITGIFKYSSDLIFDSGDFIISGDNIYICTKDNSTGDPKDNINNYKPYLYQKEATWEEFKSLYDSGNSDNDGVITSRILSKILKKLNFGIDSNGIITEEILKNYISPGLNEFTNNNVNVLDQLILDTSNTEMNNLTIKVSRMLPGCLITNKPKEISEDDFKSVLLKQYTYRESTDDENTDGKITYRIQELIDQVFGICFYRYVKLSEYAKEGEISSWKSSSINAKYINKLSAFYSLLIEKTSSIDNTKFYFKKIEFNSPSIVGTSKQYSVNLENSEVVTVTITCLIDTNANTDIYENYSMTIKPDKNKYHFPNGVEIICDNTSIILSVGENQRTNYEITDIYIRAK